MTLHLQLGDGPPLCGAVGLFNGVAYVYCGLAPGHREPCAYATNPRGERTIDREPVDAGLVELLGPQRPGDFAGLAALLRERRRGLRVPGA